MWERRAFLKAAGAGFAASLLSGPAAALAEAEMIFASATQTRDGSFGAALLTEDGAVLQSIALPDRGHDIGFSPDGSTGVVFARQPGTFALVFDPTGQRPPQTLTSIEGRHFFGHGVFSPDGKLLFATENDFEAARGVIGVYDVAGGYRRIGEYDTHGIGPHEILLSDDGALLVVANGGIETHPDYGRAELNLDTMDPSIVFIERRSGALVGQLRLAAELHQLSIRHMACDHLGRVWFGCQFRGASGDRPQLVGRATRDGDIRLIELPPEQLGGMRNYIGSVSATLDGRLVGVSSPEGDTILAIDAESGAVVATRQMKSVCGVAPDRDGLLVSSGLGEVVGTAGSDARLTRFELNFDNHLRLLRAV